MAGQLHVYFLPVGQGDATAIRCPDGSLNLYDWGSNTASRKNFWAAKELRCYLKGSIGDITSIVVTHHHCDHYNLLPDTLNEPRELEKLKNIYISCKEANMKSALTDWVKKINDFRTDENRNLKKTEQHELMKVELINDGEPCGPIKTKAGVEHKSCGQIDLCSEKTVDVYVDVLAANMGGACTDGSHLNEASIVTKITFEKISILLSGDFEDPTPTEDAKYHQWAMSDYYNNDDTKPDLKSTIYHAAHHGATYRANKEVWLKGIAPKAVVSSGDPHYHYGHPRCKLFDPRLKNVKSLCQHDASCPKGSKKQNTYTCGDENGPSEIKDNKLAIYTTVFYITAPKKEPERHLNLIDVAITKSTVAGNAGSWTITPTVVKKIPKGKKKKATPSP